MHSLPDVQSAAPGQVPPAVQLIMPVHATSHWHEAVQSIAAVQLRLPPQVTSQTPGPQVAPPTQLDGPLHVIVHAVAPLQSTPPVHELEPAQSTMHGRPAGQTTLAPHELS